MPSPEATISSTVAPSATTVWGSLPGRAVSAVAMVNGTLWLIIDPEKCQLMRRVASTFVMTVLGSDG